MNILDAIEADLYMNEFGFRKTGKAGFSKKPSLPLRHTGTPNLKKSELFFGTGINISINDLIQEIKNLKTDVNMIKAKMNLINLNKNSDLDKE